MHYYTAAGSVLVNFRSTNIIRVPYAMIQICPTTKEKVSFHFDTSTPTEHLGRYLQSLNFGHVRKFI